MPKCILGTLADLEIGASTRFAPDRERSDGLQKTTRDCLILEIEDAVARIILNRPDSLNSLNKELTQALQAAIARVNEDDAIKAIVLTGAGRGFCSGQDLTEIGPDKSIRQILDQHYRPLILALRSSSKPIIAAVNGPAAGAGVSLTLACDLIYASELASFSLAFVRIGLAPDAGGSYGLVQRIGLGRALDLVLTSRRVSADEALQIGLVDRLLPAPQLLPEAQKTAQQLADLPPLAVAATKDLLAKATVSDLETMLDLETDTQDRLSKTEDFQEGLQAFLEKRRPTFKGR